MKKNKTALITGITGQDGSYLAEFLLNKGYTVYGIKRRSSQFNTQRIDHLYEGPLSRSKKLIIKYGDLSDSNSLISVLSSVKPDEVYNLGAQSHVGVSFETPEYTSDVNALGTLRLLEGIKFLGLEKKTKFYQASTSELYGISKETPQNETTPFYPRSPYAVAKLYAYWITVNYREAYGIYACNGILFNHESERRGETFVTRKITMTLSRIFWGLDKCLFLGNLNSLRDWGHAKDSVEMQWLMLQQKEPKDYVIATGKQITVRNFVNKVLHKLGITVSWEGKGINEKAKIIHLSKNSSKFLKKGDYIVKVDKRYFRPTEVDNLLGDSSLAKNILGWNPRYSIDDLIEEMIISDLKQAKKESFIKNNLIDKE